MEITIGFSPCPNDTFIFDALVNNKIDTEGIVFKPVLEDVETLNQWALKGILDITKLSFPTYFQTKKNYQLLDSGSALGKGVGPLLVTANKENLLLESMRDNAGILLPGINTTAHLLFSYAYPHAKNKTFAIFHEIEEAIATQKFDYGVIIHESRFTYQNKGLHKVADLGAVWEKKTGVPIPLGGIVIKDTLGKDIHQKVNTLIQKSLQYSWANYPIISDYVQLHAQTMSESVMRHHIELYVNDYTLNLGEDGWLAIKTLNQVFDNLHYISV